MKTSNRAKERLAAARSLSSYRKRIISAAKLDREQEEDRMNLNDEIRLFSKREHIEILLWLSGQYHWPNWWHFVAKFTWELDSSNNIYRLWYPTMEGRILSESRVLIDAGVVIF